MDPKRHESDQLAAARALQQSLQGLNDLGVRLALRVGQVGDWTLHTAYLARFQRNVKRDGVKTNVSRRAGQDDAWPEVDVEHGPVALTLAPLDVLPHLLAVVGDLLDDLARRVYQLEVVEQVEQRV